MLTLGPFLCVSVCQSGDALSWKDLLRIRSPHKLLYALEIIEALGKPNRRIHRESTVHTITHHSPVSSGTKAPYNMHAKYDVSLYRFSYAPVSDGSVFPLTLQGSYSDLYPDSDDSSEDLIENSKNSWSCKVPGLASHCYMVHGHNVLLLVVNHEIMSTTIVYSKPPSPSLLPLNLSYSSTSFFPLLHLSLIPLLHLSLLPLLPLSLLPLLHSSPPCSPTSLIPLFTFLLLILPPLLSKPPPPVLPSRLLLLQFVSSGGLQLLLEIFNSAILEPRDNESWTVVRPEDTHHVLFKLIWV